MKNKDNGILKFISACSCNQFFARSTKALQFDPDAS